ncbi:WD40-repeat-containing domain protein [Desarmillaria tabescens]|uniref:WD40-repeat-containing domain protein n=1 Tax=Armillaria tabescens TaxID=1929756 RepID=A0AA39ND87_ARMTA|nr:WD40-repeat-containing domain protein [Desarmillaria tabescens]KAK0463510.1 WD40-repeat-containing domain protein [Desarmillaria tabescens]
MLAVAVTGSLAILDAATVKRSPSTFSPCLNLPSPPTACSWSTDNAFLFLSSSRTIHKYDPTCNSLEDLYTSPETADISHISVKDKVTIAFSAGDKVHVLECGSTPKIAQTFKSHKSPITSLAISNDGTLLASTSAGGAHVYNLSHGSHTVLRGLPLTGQSIRTCTFHAHTRARLLLGIGKQLIVFDTTRPSGLMKTIPLNASSSGDIVSVACSPFSKTLVVVATSGGNVGLVDLEKEKGLFRTLNLKIPLTSISFSPEGASIYVGTETGKFLILDLRALDKAPKSITISGSGCRVEAFCVQRKIKGAPETKANSSAAKATSEVVTSAGVRPVSAAKSAAVPSSSPKKVARLSAGHREPSVARKSSTASSPRKQSSAGPMTKKVFSPVRDPLGNSTSLNEDISMQIESLSAMRGATKRPVKEEKDKASSVSRHLMRKSSTISASTTGSPVKLTKTSPASSPKVVERARTTSASSKASTALPAPSTSPKENEPPRRTRTISSTSRTRRLSNTESISTASTQSRPIRTLSSVSRTESDSLSARSSRAPKTSIGSSASRNPSPIPPVPPLPVEVVQQQQRLSPKFSEERSRTPSPDLPDVHDADPVTPLPAKKGMAVLGLGTPEVERWIQAGEVKELSAKDRKGKGRSVGFMDPREEDGKETSMEIQISPRRATPMKPASWASSPLKHPIPNSPGGTSAHDFLRNIVGDVMFDYQKETKAQITGLHLEMVRMRRGWRKELGDIMEQYVGDLKDLREENQRLREENDRLRRGY